MGAYTYATLKGAPSIGAHESSLSSEGQLTFSKKRVPKMPDSNILRGVPEDHLFRNFFPPGHSAKVSFYSRICLLNFSITGCPDLNDCN